MLVWRVQPAPYPEFSDLMLMALCCWREGRGEPIDGKRGICHVIWNRVLKPGWWGHSVQTVILKPYQFSSFNASDPNSDQWPHDTDPSWAECISAASGVYLGVDLDITDGATHYFDTSIDWPAVWGKEWEFVNTLNVGRLKFYRPV